jgi:hypothetical protein
MLDKRSTPAERYPNNKAPWFGKNCKWHICQFEDREPGDMDTPVLTFCNLQEGGLRDYEGNCQMEYCPMLWPGLRITEPNDTCPICGKPLTVYNVSYKGTPEDTQKLHLDSLGRAWCIECAKKHDSIDWG